MKNVKSVQEVELSLAQNQKNVQHVMVMEKLEHNKVFLHFNKLAQIVMEMEKCYQILVKIVEALAQLKLKRIYPFKFQRELMMVHKCDYLAKEMQATEEDPMVIFMF